MKSLKEIISEKLVIGKNMGKSKGILCPKSFRELADIITKRSKQNTLSLDLSDIDVSNVDTFSDLSGFSIFGGCSTKTESIDVTGWNVSHIHNMFELFSYMTNLKAIYGLEDWDVSNVNNMQNAFYRVPDDVVPSWYDRNKWEKL